MEKFEKVWRDFENNPISHSVAHYLFAVFSLQENGTFPKAVEVSKKLGVSRNAVSMQLKSLQENELITVDETHRIHLTEKGTHIVNIIASKRISFKAFLIDVLGVKKEIAERDSCKVEHLLSAQTSAAILSFMNYLKKCDSNFAEFIDKFKNSELCCENDQGCGICSNTCLINDSKIAS